MRDAEVKRYTKETGIELWLELDGSGKSTIDTGVGFLDHMLTLLAKHSGFDIMLKCEGDTYVDDHHTVEDIGICLGKAFSDAVGDKRGIKRYGNAIIPMDEALILAAVDISGRDYLGYGLEIPTEKVGSFDTELVEEFMLGFVRNAQINLHLKQFAGKNSHHIIEGSFKALARALRDAVSIDERFRNDIPSTKGTLSDEREDGMISVDGYDWYQPKDFQDAEDSVETEEDEPIREDLAGANRNRDEDDEIEYYDDDCDGQEILEQDIYDEYDDAYEETFDGAGYEEEDDEYDEPRRRRRGLDEIDDLIERSGIMQRFGLGGESTAKMKAIPEDESTGLGDDSYSKGIAHGGTIEIDEGDIDSELRKKGLI